jgi:hypothetical protein
MITIYAHDPELFPSAQSQNHTPHLSRELTVPLVSLTPEDQITFSGISDTKPNDNSCRKPHDSFAEGSYPLLYHISQWPRRIRGTSSPPYNPLGKACLHPRGKPRGTRQSVVIEKTWIVPLTFGSRPDSSRPVGRPRNESGPAGEDSPGESASPPPSDAEIEGRLNFLLIRPGKITTLSGRIPQGSPPGDSDSP